MGMPFRLAGTMRHSCVDGPGVRYVVFFQGCPHHCPGCQNPDTWNPEGGTLTDTDKVIAGIKATRYLDGVTLSGGDPFLQPEAAFEIATAVKGLGLSVWIYTGWRYEELLSMPDPAVQGLLGTADVLVDGCFDRTLRRDGLKYRGSENQRIIDLKASADAGQAVLMDI